MHVVILGYSEEKEAMNTILCFFSLSFIGWICLLAGLSKSRHFRARAADETSRAEGTIQGYEIKEKPWGRGPTAKCYHPVVSFTVDGHPYTATSDFYYLEMRGQEPKRLLEGSNVVLYYNQSNPFKFHLEQETDDRGMERIGLYCIVFAAVATTVCTLVFKW